MRVFFLVNIGRRRANPPAVLLEQMAAVFQRRGVECRMELSSSVEESQALLLTAARQGYDSLWIGGGDGTINHVLNTTIGLFDTYAIVPMGTINGLARALGTPRNPVEAVEWLLSGEPSGLELVRVGNRYFVLYATIGFHAAVFHRTNEDLKRLFGRAAFFAAGALEACYAGRSPAFEVEFHLAGQKPGVEPGTPAADGPEPAIVTADELPHPSQRKVCRRTGYALVISNFLNFAGFGAVREGDVGDSSYLLAHLFPGCSLWPMLRFFAAVRYRRPREDDPGVEHFRVSEVYVRSEQPLRLQVDGEPVSLGDNREFHFQCLPNAVRVLWQPPVPSAVAELPSASGRK